MWVGVFFLNTVYIGTISYQPYLGPSYAVLLLLVNLFTGTGADPGIQLGGCFASAYNRVRPEPPMGSRVTALFRWTFVRALEARWSWNLKDIHFLMPKGGQNLAHCQGSLGSCETGPTPTPTAQVFLPNRYPGLTEVTSDTTDHD